MITSDALLGIGQIAIVPKGVAMGIKIIESATVCTNPQVIIAIAFDGQNEVATQAIFADFF